MLYEKVKKLKSLVKNSVVFDGAKPAKLDFTNAMLTNSKNATLPPEYIEFLKITNGMIIPPYEFYGSEVIDRKDYNYKYPSIMEINKTFVQNKNPLIENRIVIGNVFFDTIIYDKFDNNYKIVNRINFEIIKSFSSFSNLLDYIIESM